MLSKENGIKVSTQQRARSRTQASREKLKEEREQIVLWKHPLTTLNYSTRELFITLIEWAQKCLQYKLTLALVSIIISLAVVLYRIDGPHKEHVQSAEKYLLLVFLVDRTRSTQFSWTWYRTPYIFIIFGTP